ncbi:helix-turn-helix domain-containing protein [bacterium]|nr:helix-turn-helix domain-containing protein [bacterium]
MSIEQFETIKEKKFMRAKELAKHLGIGLSTLWLWNKQGKFTSIKVSEKVTLFNVADVEKALFGEVK